MSGFIVIQRAALEHHLIGDAKHFRPWCWMLSSACWKPIKYNISGKTITLQRGQFCASIRQMADEWGWSKSAVERFLTRLETETMIVREAGHGKLIITICNYEKYQSTENDDRDSSGTASGTAAGQQRDIKEQGNKGTIEVEEAKASPTKSASASFPCPDGCDPDDWQALISVRKAARRPMNAGAYRQILKKLEGWSRDGWPPGPILALAAERGWQTVFPTDEMKAQGNDRGQQNFRNTSSPGRRDGAAKALDRQLGFDEPPGPPGRYDAGDGGGNLPLAITADATRR